MVHKSGQNTIIHHPEEFDHVEIATPNPIPIISASRRVRSKHRPDDTNSDAEASRAQKHAPMETASHLPRTVTPTLGYPSNHPAFIEPAKVDHTKNSSPFVVDIVGDCFTANPPQKKTESKFLAKWWYT